MKFTRHKTTRFTVTDQFPRCPCTMLYNHRHRWGPQLRPSKLHPNPLAASPRPSPARQPPACRLFLRRCPFWTVPVRGLVRVSFRVWLPRLGTMRHRACVVLRSCPQHRNIPPCMPVCAVFIPRPSGERLGSGHCEQGCWERPWAAPTAVSGVGS